jgi:release factor glutamine methyltransferase
MLLAHVLGQSRAWILAHDTDPLSEPVIHAFKALVARRLQGEPMAYLLQSREFMGHLFKVGPEVLIPRPETELLVTVALEQLTGVDVATVLELGTGSGAIAIALAMVRPELDVLATDCSVKALQLAADNARRLGATVRFAAGNWYGALIAGQTFDMIIANPPYISRDDPHLVRGDLRFEPRLALTDEGDGLEALRLIIAGAPAHLKPGGMLWVEHGWDQAPSVRALLTERGLRDVVSRCDLAGVERISGGYLS